MIQYAYCGPSDLLELVNQLPQRFKIKTPSDIDDWFNSTESTLKASRIVATYIINLEQQLVLADRHSEHVVCAGGQAVLGAGEITLYYQHKQWRVDEITNQSTGYCPAPESWAAVQTALSQLAIKHPEYFTYAFIFRQCRHCNTVNIIKNNDYECAVCHTFLP